MSDEAVVTLGLSPPEGPERAALVLQTLPGQPQDTLVGRRNDPGRLASEPLVQVREATIYHYRIESEHDGPLRVQPAELFDRDDATGRTGRFRPGEAVGFLEIEAYFDGTLLGSTAVEVRAFKLEHEVEYRRMLRDISGFASDALLQGFQPAAESFELQGDAPLDLLYRRFAVLSARLNDPTFLAAVGHVLGRPHNDWVHETEWRDPSLPLGGGPALQRALVTGRPRRDWPEAPTGSPMRTLPRAVEVRRHEASVDTLPNRVVKFALEDWRSVASATAEAVAKSLTGSPRERGLRATRAVLERLDEWLAAPMFRSVGRLTTFPQGNQVLLKREGYRQLFASWTISSSGADVAVDLDDPLRISQRNVATLYEYWCFLQLTAIVADVCGTPAPVASLFQSVTSGMALGLRQGRASKLEWATEVAGRELHVELFFNRSFPAATQSGTGSWTKAMRPDCSLRIEPMNALPQHAPHGLETWLHFDAKYRVDFLVQQFSEQPDEVDEAAEAERQETLGESKRADLLKMHAYRDAIRRTAGAYVLFPGSEAGQFKLDTELLPGIGAFPMRPTAAGGAAAGNAALRAFLASVLDHVANQASRHERSRFWTERIAAEGRLPESPDPPMEHLDFPPADTSVLLVPVAAAIDMEWILKSRTCVLPPDPQSARSMNDSLTPNFLLLHGPALAHQVLVRRVSDWVPMGRAELDAIAAPRSTHPAELCCGIAPVDDAPWWINSVDVELLGARDTACVTWLDLVAAVRAV